MFSTSSLVMSASHFESALGHGGLLLALLLEHAEERRLDLGIEPEAVVLLPTRPTSCTKS